MPGAMEAEQQIREACDGGRLEAAASATIELYGPEILSFLRARLGTRNDAQEVFSMFVEDFWTGLAGFGWRCSIRTWSYTLARNAAIRFLSDPHRRVMRNLALAAPDHLSMIVEKVRTATQLHEQTSVKDRVRELRSQLDIDDQMLLVLRVDRGMAWRDVAMTMLGDLAMEDATLDKKAAQLRKQFERVKDDIKRRALNSGLLKPEL